MTKELREEAERLFKWKQLNCYQILPLTEVHAVAELAGDYIESINELSRLRRGDFTPEEIQNFCHPLDETSTPREFADGCAEWQRKLFGCALDAMDAKRWRWWCNLVLTMNDCGRDRESLAKEIETGRFCRRVEHITGSCDCEEIAEFIRTFGTKQ